MFACLSATAQLSTSDPSNTSPRLFPPSPEASALGKYIEIPVSLYTGIPQIEVPVAVVKDGDVSVPVSLSYQSGGIRADELASRVGLGWVLNAGGVVTRTIRGYADEFGQGFLNWSRTVSPENFFSGTDQEKFQRWHNIAMECGDAEPDEFFINFNGFSGRFAFNWDGTISYSCTRKLKITPIGLPAPGQQAYIQGWQIISDDGMKYEFTAIEHTRVVNFEEFFSCTLRKRQANSWYLTKITSPTGDWVNFSYVPYTLYYRIFASQVIKHKNGYQTGSTQSTIMRNHVEGVYLDKITTSSGQMSVEFIANTPRTDFESDGSIYGTSNYNSLDQILIKNSSGALIRKYALAYDYSTARLTLKSVTETGSDGVTSKPPTKFEYKPGSFPTEIISYRKDHWGYLNNNSKNTLLPPYCSNTLAGPIFVDGANREADAAGSQTGLLTKITYPAGGFQEFEYEPHDYSTQGYQTLSRHLSLTMEGRIDSPNRPAQVLPFTVGTVAGCAGAVRVNYYLVQNSDFTFGGTRAPKVKILDSQGYPVFSAQNNASGTTYVILQPGNYSLTAYATMVNDENVADVAMITLNWEERVGDLVNMTKIAGGARIKTITSQASANDPNKIIRRFEYSMAGADGLQSSGVILNEITDQMYNTWTMTNSGSGDIGTYSPESYLTRLSSSRSILGSTQGSHIGYREVTVYNGLNGENGKTVSKFSSPYETRDDVLQEFPYPPARSYDFKRGLLKETIEYKKEAGNYVATRKSQYSYKFSMIEIPAYKVGMFIDGAGPFGAGFLNRYGIGNYTLNLGFSQTDTTRNDLIVNGKTLRNESYTDYDPTLRFVSKHTRKVSAGKQLITQFYYPQDYSSPSPALTALVSRHMFPGIEEITYEKGSDGVQKAIAGTFTEFGFFNNLLLPSKTYRLITTAPIANFNGTIANSGAAVDPAVYGEAMRNIHYDSSGNPLQVKSKEKENESYIWGYNKTFAVASVQNAALADIAYCDFEDAGQGGFIFDTNLSYYTTNARTGRRAYSGSNISRAISTTRSFKLSLWAKGSTGSTVAVNNKSQTAGTTWTYLEWDIVDPATITVQTNSRVPNSGSVTIAISGCVIDGVRLQPAGSLMQTYTYDPLIGVTSKTSSNNTTTFYEYDALGRLSVVRDNKGNIVKTHNYYY